MYRLSQKKVYAFGGYGRRIMWSIFKIRMLIFQSMAKLVKKILFGKITHHLDPEIREMMERGMFGSGNSTFQFGSLFTYY